jgi:Poxvirus D5 protein-like
MKHALGALGVLAAGVLLAVSAAINWRFGYGLGMTEMDKQIFAAASAAADCFKALVPFFFFAAWKNRMWSQVAASAVLWVVVTAYSFTSAIGHSAHNRMDTNGQRAVDASSYKDLRNDLKRAQDQMSWIPQHRPIETVAGEVETYKLQRAWVQTKSCTEVSGPTGRDFCGKYQGLLSERASGEQAKKWASEISEINAKLANAKGTNAMAEADPQAAVLAKLASLVLPGIKTEDVQTALAIFVAVLLEIGSGFGMYVAFSTWRLYDRAAPSVPLAASARTVDLASQPMSAAKPRLGVANDNKSSPKLIAPETDVIRFRNERIEDAEGTSLTATTLYEDYCAWCEEQQKEPLALPTFGREFGDLGVQKAKIAGRVRYIGIALKSGTELEFEEDKKLPAPRAA